MNILKNLAKVLHGDVEPVVEVPDQAVSLFVVEQMNIGKIMDEFEDLEIPA